MTRNYYNTTDTPLVIDDEGHFIEARSRKVLELNARVQYLVSIENLIDVGPDPDNPEEQPESSKEPALEAAGAPEEANGEGEQSAPATTIASDGAQSAKKSKPRNTSQGTK